ncbi:MAG: malto-oligosyltrehalose synthase [Chroococcidiopsidaceae cyanobacterium CP_BM_RX_35]|nr:malto-oligosyltrehalose synthase [Chroococcidiopsidaceae cyanobacterium CP_BM_RX_35]
MRIPTATYRIQFNSNFGFESAKKIVAYLADLGISDLYASPIFKARTGSTHGYDVVDPNQINPELGSEESFKELVSEIKQYNMGWLQDIVPNHMAYDSQNQLLMDVLENGSNSDSFDYFDIDWNHPYETIRGRVLAPLLGNYYGDCLENGEIQLQYDQTGLSVNYYGLRLPVKIESYARFITHNLGKLTRALGRNHPDFIKLLGILYLLKNTDDEPKGKERYDQFAFVKGLIWETYTGNPEVKEFIDGNVEFFNGEPGKPESFNPLDSLISEQFYRLSFWKVGAEEINYRRFFTVNELISVKVEEIKVFHKTHELISQLVESDQVTGLRVDHIDGLYDPTEYLNRLREKVGDVYITVEKILEQKEDLPDFWPIQGTSGYDFLNYVNGVFCQTENYQHFSDIYTRLTGFNTPYEQLFRDKKRLIIDKNLAGDVDNLAQLLKRVSGYSRAGSDFTQHGLQRALTEVLTYFPVYRTYINQDGLRDVDRHYLDEVIAVAKEQVPLLLKELDYIEKILSLEGEEFLTTEQKEEQRHFVMKLQQLTGPLMAKGIEDTLLYVYYRLLSLNEVGGNPSQFGITVADFHEFNQKQQSLWPYKMNATATHDTKRGEDARARINVISEIPEEWEKQVKAWSELNAAKKRRSHGLAVPDRNDEYFFYQTLVGSFPFVETEYTEFVERVKDYVVKAIREAKVHTAWLRPDTEYEEGFVAFVEEVLQPTEDNQFLQELRSFQQRVADYGIFNSLSQTLLKMTAPGVPDFYQGSELWDLSFVDPDNRRPVDFEQRATFLKDIKHKAQTDILSLMSELLSTRADGRIKLFLISRVLETRKQNLAIFETGDYQPLEVAGKFKDHIVAFAKSDRQNVTITIAPRLLTNLIQPGESPFGEKVWDDTQVKLPEGMPSEWQEVIASQSLKSYGTISVGAALEHFPVALLIGKS